MVIMTGCRILSNSFIASIEMILVVFLHCIRWHITPINFCLLTYSQTRNKSHFVTVYNSFNVKKQKTKNKKHITSMVMVLRFRTSQIFQFLTPSPLFRPGLENFHSTDKDLFYTRFRVPWSQSGCAEHEREGMKENPSKRAKCWRKVSRRVRIEYDFNPVFYWK